MESTVRGTKWITCLWDYFSECFTERFHKKEGIMIKWVWEMQYSSINTHRLWPILHQTTQLLMFSGRETHAVPLEASPYQRQPCQCWPRLPSPILPGLQNTLLWLSCFPQRWPILLISDLNMMIHFTTVKSSMI